MSNKEEKKCYRCNEIKLLAEFHKNKRRPDGFSTACKPCAIEARKDWSKQNKDYVLERDRNYYTRNAETVKAREKKRKLENPIKKYAHEAVRGALRTGKITKQGCFVCGSDKTDGHHEDYSKPLSVFWLCRSHHKQVHVGSIKLPIAIENCSI